MPQAGPRDGGSQPSRPTFQPSYVEARGWCTFQDRRTKGLTREQCAAIVDSLKTQLAPEVAARVGAMQVRGLRSYTFRIAVSGGEGPCGEVCGVANDLVAAGTLSLPEGYTNRRSLRFGQEKSPEAQAWIGTIVRILRAAETALQTRVAADGRWAGVTAEPH